MNWFKQKDFCFSIKIKTMGMNRILSLEGEFCLFFLKSV